MLQLWPAAGENGSGMACTNLGRNCPHSSAVTAGSANGTLQWLSLMVLAVRCSVGLTVTEGPLQSLIEALLAGITQRSGAEWHSNMP